MEEKIMTRLLMSGLIAAALWIGGTASSAGQGDGKTLQKAEIFVQLGHGSNVAAVAFSPDGHIIVSGGMDSTLKLWDPEPPRVFRRLPSVSHAAMA
jgi:WD40 repeat protein